MFLFLPELIQLVRTPMRMPSVPLRFPVAALSPPLLRKPAAWLVLAILLPAAAALNPRSKRHPRLVPPCLLRQYQRSCPVHPWAEEREEGRQEQDNLFAAMGKSCLSHHLVFQGGLTASSSNSSSSRKSLKSEQWKRVAQVVTAVTAAVMEKRLSKRGGGSFSNTHDLTFLPPWG